VWELPVLVTDPTPADLRAWLRRNANAGAGPIHVFVGHPPLPPSQPGTDVASATIAEFLDWWEGRAELRVPARPTADGCEFIFAGGPEFDGDFALLVPVRWRDRALAGWDADWGSVTARKVQRFDRSYRLFSLSEASPGDRLRVRYR
jgi:hypothetical protein